MKLVGIAMALSLAFGGTAMAHDTNYRHSHEYSRYQPGTQLAYRYNDRRYDDRRYDRHYDRRYDRRYDHRYERRYERPRHWRHSNSRWERHVRACFRKYRHYDPRTDRYLSRSGYWKRCRA